MLKLGLSAALLAGLVASQAHAAGYEKSVLWSGKHAGSAAAGAPAIVSGSQSLFFNPAGLAGGEGGDVTLNFSPSWIKLEGNIASTASKEQTDDNFSPIGAASVAYKITEALGVGFSAHVAGGSKAVYDNVDLRGDASNVTLTPKIQTDLRLMEYSVGAGYQVAPGWKLGLAWRIMSAKGSLSTIKKTVTNTAYSYVNIENAKQTKYNGFRLGVQYDNPNDVWGVGFVFRNNIDFVAEGSGTGSTTVIGTNATTPGNDGRTKLGTSFPLSFGMGSYYRLSSKLRGLFGVDFQKYSKNTALSFVGTRGGTALPNLPLNWKDQYNVRLGAEYGLSNALTLRGGYSLTTRVSSKTDARATIAPPGTGHLLAAGAGTKFMGGKLELDGALEYAFNSADGSMSSTPQGSTTKELLAGVNTETKANTFAIHTGVSYKF